MGKRAAEKATKKALKIRDSGEGGLNFFHCFIIFNQKEQRKLGCSMPKRILCQLIPIDSQNAHVMHARQFRNQQDYNHNQINAKWLAAKIGGISC